MKPFNFSQFNKSKIVPMSELCNKSNQIGVYFVVTGTAYCRDYRECYIGFSSTNHEESIRQLFNDPILEVRKKPTLKTAKSFF